MYYYRGAAMYWVEHLVENTLRVCRQYRIVLWFMGTIEESLMTWQFRTRVQYMG